MKPSPPSTVGDVTIVRPTPTLRESGGYREARFALDNCNEQQRRWICSLGALLTDSPNTFADILSGQVFLSARRDGSVATIRMNPQPGT